MKHWAGSALLGSVLAGLIFGVKYPYPYVALLGAMTMIVLLEPVRRAAARKTQARFRPGEASPQAGAATLALGNDGTNEDPQVIIERLTQRVRELEALDRQAATFVESTIALRTHFTGDPPYVGWRGLGLALTETLDAADILQTALQQIKDASTVRPINCTPPDMHAINAMATQALRKVESFRSTGSGVNEAGD